jgi:hypothetical protein
MGLLCHKLYLVVDSELPEQAKDPQAADVGGAVERSLALETDQAVPLAAAAAKGEVDLDDLGEAFSIKRPTTPTTVQSGSIAAAKKVSGVSAAKPAPSAQASKPAAVKALQKAPPKAILANAYSSSEEDEEPGGKAKHKRKAKAVDTGPVLPFFIDRGGEIEEIPPEPVPASEAPVAGGTVAALAEQGDSSEGEGEEGKGQGEGATKKKRNRRKKRKQKQGLETMGRDASLSAPSVQSMDVSVKTTPAVSGKAAPESTLLPPAKQPPGKVASADKVKKAVAPSKPKQKRKLDDIDKIFAASKKKG